MVQLRLAGVVSVFPSVSVALAWKVCGPLWSFVKVTGDVHVLQPPLSRLHSNVAPPSFDEKSNSADESPVVPDGPKSIVACGAVASRVNDRVAGLGSVFDAESVACTENVYDPSASEL